MKRFSRGMSWACMLLSAHALAGNFRYTALDIGQGDSTLIVTPSGCAALIDGGPTGSGATLKAYLKANQISHLDFVVATHMHEDHIGGLDEIVQGSDAVSVGVAYDNGNALSTVSYANYAQAYLNRRVIPAVGQTLSLCSEVRVEFVAVNGNGRAVASDENTRSIVLRISYGALDAVVGGDLPAAPYNLENVVAPLVGRVEIYKVHHHGSKDSSSDLLLSQLQPLVATISVGQNNYGHPSVEALTRLSAHGVEVYQTSIPATRTRLGPIEIQSAQGRIFEVKQGASSKTYSSHGIDATPPSVPDNLQAVDVTDGAVRLRWTHSTDNVGVVGYKVLRYEAWVSQPLEVARTSSTEIWDVGLSPANVYRYGVIALDLAGNESAPAEISVTTQTRLPITVPARPPPASPERPSRPSRE